MGNKTDEEKTGEIDISAKAEKAEKKDSPLSWLLTIVITAAAVLLFCNFVARPSQVMGDSMQNTCHDGDLVILWELNYHPQRGDIVVVNKNNPLNKNLIKRVIAVGGDKINIYDGKVTLNGKELKENYIKEQLWQGNNVSMTVQKGEIFLMGDNRNHSADSRVIGAVSEKKLMGKVVFRLFPFNKMGTL